METDKHELPRLSGAARKKMRYVFLPSIKIGESAQYATGAIYTKTPKGNLVRRRDLEQQRSRS